MIYCNLIRNGSDEALYEFGISTEKMIGTVNVSKYKPPEIVDMKEDVKYIQYFLAKIYTKYKNDFANGIFKNKLSYEC